MFDKKGLIIVDKEECDMDADDLMMIALVQVRKILLTKRTALRLQQRRKISVLCVRISKKKAFRWPQQK